MYHWGYSNRAAARKCRKERHSAAFLSPRESPRCCTIPSGTDSHFAQALVFVSRGLVAKNAPQEHFLNAPTNGAPKYALQEIAARFLLQSFKEGSIWCTIG